MSGIFDTLLNSTSGLSDVTVSVDPFTGKAATFVPPVVRYPGGPVVTRDKFIQSVQRQSIRNGKTPEVPRAMHDLKDTYNCGVSHFDGGYVMLVRFQNASRYNHVYVARSDDGIDWEHEAKLAELPGLPPAPAPEGIAATGHNIPPDKPWRPGIVYDPRITQTSDGDYYVTLAIDYDTLETPGSPYISICDNVLFRTRDFEKFEFISVMGGYTRNCLLFPRKIDGFWYAAGRPNTSKRVNTVLMRSVDLVKWEHVHDLFSGGHAWMIFAGPGFPPFETKEYWVLGMHAVETHGTFQIIYRAGVCLLDKKTMKVVHGPVPILHPERDYEMSGTVESVIFPTGIVFSDGNAHGVKTTDTKAAIYYGAADTSLGVGLTTVGRLIQTARGEYNPFLP